MNKKPASKTAHKRFTPPKWFLYIKDSLGPGVVAGAADDDPSGIATYSMAGAQLGTSLLWTAFLTWPLMAAVQMMCARIGMVTGKGLAAALNEKFPKWMVRIAIVALFIANTINIGADLAGMADAAHLLSGINSHWFVVVFAVGISWATISLRYQQIATALKLLALALFSYLITAFIVHPDWSEVAKAAFLPSMPHGKASWAMLVAIMGTTISPYLFFWQSSQEVEEDKAIGRDTLAKRKNATAHEVNSRKLDIGIGAFFSNIVMFFIILTTALTLNKHGIENIETSAQAAEALKPLAGNFASLLFTIGVLGVGFLAIPTLTGSAAYAFAESFSWKQGLDKTFKQARSFYAVVLFSTTIGVAIDFSSISPVKALYGSAVVNGLLAPFLLVGIFLVASDKKLMNGQPSSLLGRIVVAVAILAMFVAGIAMFAVN